MMVDPDCRTPRWLLCTWLVGAAACAPLSHGAFTPTSFSSGYGYDIPYQPGTKVVMPAGWELDNYRLDGSGWVQKQRDPYVTSYSFDDNGDGRVDGVIKTYTYALRFEHRVHSGVIWLRNIPLSSKLRDKDLRVLMQSYIDEITGATYETVRLGEATTPVVVEHRQAAMVVEEGPATIAGRPAYTATIDIADVDQIKLAPGVRARRVQLVLMRSPEDERYERDGKPTLVHPVVVLAGYSNMPTDFPTGLGDFHDLLGRLTIAGQAGLTLGPAPTAEPPPAEPPPAAPPATSAPQ
jgi:hypothetical protein